MKQKPGSKTAAFSLVEVLVALSIIAMASSSIISLLSNATRFLRIDEKLQSATYLGERYLSELYLAPDLKKALFTTNELALLGPSPRVPRMLPPERISTPEGILMLVNKKIRRWQPLLVDVGIELIWQAAGTNARQRQYWLETTLSEEYLTRLK